LNLELLLIETNFQYAYNKNAVSNAI
jgi:hypothetical protein